MLISQNNISIYIKYVLERLQYISIISFIYFLVLLSGGVPNIFLYKYVYYYKLMS